MLITTLLFILVLLILGIGFVGSQAARYRAVTRAAEEAQAKALAVAALEDARVKMENDVDFPPAPSGKGQTLFSYSERLDQPGGVAGTYTVLIDRSKEPPPYQVDIITAVGSVGPSNAPIAQHTIRAELDVALYDRATGAANLRYFRYTHLEDEGSL